MFRHDSFFLGSYEGITLVNDDSGTQISFIPDCGGTITTLKLVSNGSLHSVLDPILTDQELIDNIAFKNTWLAPFPNRIANGNYTFNEVDYSLPKNDGGISALHGFVFNKKFEIAKVECSADHASIQLTHMYNGDYPGYPFPFICTVSYEIREDYLETEIEIENIGKSEIPVGLGWHPYFRFQSGINHIEMTLPELTSFKLGANGIPLEETEDFDSFTERTIIGENQFDHCFFAANDKTNFDVVLHDPKEQIELKFSQQSEYEFWQIYTPPHRNSIAIEPMTCAVDSFNNRLGLKTLESGKTLSAKCGLTLKKRVAGTSNKPTLIEHSN